MHAFKTKAMLVGLRVNAWTATRKDDAASGTVHAHYSAAHDSGAYNKALIAKVHLKPIQKVDSAIRQFHKDNTLPWMNDGTRILPSANHSIYTAGIRKLKDERQIAVDQFIADYPAHVTEASIKLGGMFDMTDYPHVWDLAALYSVDVIPLPFPDAQDFRLDIAASDMDGIKAETEKRINDAQAAAMDSLFNRVAEVVSRISEKLSVPIGKKNGSVFRDSLIENAADLIEVSSRSTYCSRFTWQHAGSVSPAYHEPECCVYYSGGAAAHG